MSSLAAARADNFYYPPEWRPEMGGISKFQGSKGANQYQQFGIIRFELPFDSWCLGCKRHMCKGLRFNAKKDKDGNYFSTTIWSFKMKCPSCDQQFVIKTDPKNSTYDMFDGIRKMEQDFIPESGDSLIQATSDEVKEQLTLDPIFRLQHEKEDKAVADIAKTQLSSLIDLRDSIARNDYEMNSALRHAHRTKRKRSKELLEEGNKLGLSIPLAEPHEDDSNAAKLVKYHQNNIDVRRIKEKKKLIQIQSESIFTSSSNNKQSKYLKSHTHSNQLVTTYHKDITNKTKLSSEAIKQKQRDIALNKQLIQRINTSQMKSNNINTINNPQNISKKQDQDIKFQVQKIDQRKLPLNESYLSEIETLTNKSSEQDSSALSLLFNTYDDE